MRINMNAGWEFRLMDADTPDEVKLLVSDGDWCPVHLPHDWLIYDTSDLYRDGLGVYRRTIYIDADLVGHYFLIFDGVYMDSIYYLNGQRVGEWKYGYSQYVLDITDHVHPGENELLVSVRHRSPNTRWYSGAGIYRDVWLSYGPSAYIPENGVYVHTECMGDGYDLEADVEIAGTGVYDSISCTLSCDSDPDRVYGDDRFVSESRGDRVHFHAHIAKPLLWDTDTPNLYTLQVDLRIGEGDDASELQTVKVPVGFRTIVMDPQTGFSVNGRHLKLNGVCEHHDLGLLGAEFNRSAMRRKLEILRGMGVNAIRGTHNMMAPGFIELCDEMGFFFISEAFDMWEHPKTAYDYARFFPDWHTRDVASWVRRDRNHPCVIMWSIGNEISDIHTDAQRGMELTRELRDLVRQHDYMHNAPVTHGSNYMPWENAQRCAGLLETVGYNYGESCYADHHAKHPDWVIYGSETSSLPQSRGIYHMPLSARVLSDDDEQCSAYGNSPSSWGVQSFEICAGLDRDTQYSLGQFLWTGFDYIGEPTPYKTRSSYFGHIDTAGFPKDGYFFWKSVWTGPDTDPFVHIFPYWDFNIGQTVDVRVVSNLDEVELFVNGVSQGRQSLDHAPCSGMHMIADYSVGYAPGEIRALGYRSGSDEAAAMEVRRTPGCTDHLIYSRYEFKTRPDPDELIFWEICAVDADGNPVDNACDTVRVSVSGPGSLIGLDNGDSSDPDGYRVDTKRLFGGRLLAMVRPARDADLNDITLNASIDRNGIPDVRKIELIRNGAGRITPDNASVRVDYRILPREASRRDVRFSAVDDVGVSSPLVDLKVESRSDPEKEEYDGSVYITPKGDGSFRLRATAGNEYQSVRVISELDMECDGFGVAFYDPYKFVFGSLYVSAEGRVSNGNEKGFATARDGCTIVTFDRLDFGRVGSDVITVPVFSLDSDEVTIRIWRGIPGEEGSELLLDTVYNEPRVWNTYIPETYHLSRRLTGVSSISFELHQKVHIRGFVFERTNSRGEVFSAADADSIYGDSFSRNGPRVEHIGNNVSVTFRNIDLGDDGCSSIAITGHTQNDTNPIHLRFVTQEGEIRQVVSFEHTDLYDTQIFELDPVYGICDLSFVFLPGSDFDFESFEFPI